MTNTRLAAVKSTSASRLVLILPMKGQKVKGIGPSALEVLIRSREEKPAGTTDRPVVAARLGHDLNARL